MIRTLADTRPQECINFSLDVDHPFRFCEFLLISALRFCRCVVATESGSGLGPRRATNGLPAARCLRQFESSDE